MDEGDNPKKLLLIIEYVLEDKIVLKENHKERLLKFIEEYDDKTCKRKMILGGYCFPDALFQGLGNISNVSTSAQVFLIQFVTILYKTELLFNKLHTQGFKESFCKIWLLDNLKGTPSSSLHLACIKLLTVQITHISGLKVILEYKLWKNILQPNIHLKPKNISYAAYDFMTKLVLKLEEYNLESELIEVLEHILEPIINSEYINLPVIDFETDTALSEKIYTNFSALIAIITKANKLEHLSKVVPLLKEYFQIHSKLFEIYAATKNKQLIKLINAYVFQLNYGVSRHLLFDKKISEFCMKMTIAHRNYIIFAVNKRDPYAIIDYIIQCNLMWSDIEKTLTADFVLPLTFEQNGHKIEFSLQIVVHMIVPMHNYVGRHRIARKLEISDMLEYVFVKMGKSLTDYIYTCCYKFSQLLDADISRTKVTTLALKELLRLKGHLNESQAGSLFQSLYYILEIFTLSDGAGGIVVKENPMDQNDLRLLTHLLDAMKMLLKDHNISWYENLEIVNVQADLLNLLKQNFLTTKHIVQILDLIDICVKKFLSPNMSLLIESKCRQGSTLNDIGEVIKLYTQHQAWEVRDSAFNLLNSCTNISFIKYIPLQDVIKENNLIILAAKAGLSDPELYSQCTALRCLAAATKIDTMWQGLLIENEHIHLQLVYLLRKHPEGMVRKELANVLTGVYVNNKIEPALKNTLYAAMSTAALDDLHWEVQLTALNFWKKVIQNNLTNIGMLDGKFPSVTFSKTKKKIIVLDKEEIRRQLTGVMNDLSEIGCLTVLVECMNEIHNIDVMGQAHYMAKQLIQILNEYNMEKVDTVAVTGAVLPQCIGDNNLPMDLIYMSSEEDRNIVIDSILSKDQIELIIQLHDNFRENKSDEMDIDYPCYPDRKIVRTNEFLDIFRGVDYSLLIENKKNFYSNDLGTLETLLDEILSLEALF